MPRLGITRLLNQTARDNRRPRWAIVALLLCAALLRTYDLDSNSVETDEIYTLEVAGPESGLVDVVSVSLARYPVSKPPLYFLLAHLFLRLQDHDFLLRFPSLAFGVLGVATTYVAGTALFGRKVGLVGAFLLCISPLHIRYSQWARFYPLLMAFSLLSLYFLYRAMFEGNRRSWAGFIVATVLNLYTHFFALLVLLSECLFFILLWLQGLAATRRPKSTLPNEDQGLKSQSRVLVRRSSILAWIASLTVIVVAYTPMIPLLFATIGGPRGIAEDTETPGLEFSLPFFKGVLMEWSTGPGVASVLLLVLFLVGVSASLRKQGSSIVLALLWIGVPFGVLFTFPMGHRFYLRYLVFMLPMYLIVIGRGLMACDGLIAGLLGRIGDQQRGANGVGLTVGLALFGAVTVCPLQGYYSERASDWRAVASFLANNMSSGEAVLVRRPEFASALLHYDERLESAELGVLTLRDPLPADLPYEQGIWFVGKESRNDAMSRLERELVALTGGPVFKLVFQGCGNHHLPGAGEHMFWDLWVLYTRQGLDEAQLTNLYRHALDTVPPYAIDFVEKALHDLSVEGQRSEALIDAGQVPICLHLGVAAGPCAFPAGSCGATPGAPTRQLTASIRGHG